ncbi:cell adhesion molecule Dscam1-like [Tachypleus tridentatus]|uniref:cell adhesion molecule Dscam1-like n=1 Tax=Tachypleus tridentatus TaxID=6853 RepID=UPI003FCFF779
MRNERCHWIIKMIFVVLIQAEGLSTSLAKGPSFILEPPNHVSFYNTTGAIIPCSATGNPLPVVLWTDGFGTRLEDIPGLRRSRFDGSLIFSSFPVDQYQQSVHSTSYRCVASNTVGTIGSRDVHVRAGTFIVSYFI